MIDFFLFTGTPPQALPLPSVDSFIQENFVDFLGPNLTAFFGALAGVTIVKMLIFKR